MFFRERWEMCKRIASERQPSILNYLSTLAMTYYNNEIATPLLVTNAQYRCVLTGDLHVWQADHLVSGCSAALGF